MRWRHGDTIPAPERAADSARDVPTALHSRLKNLPAGHPSSADYRRSPSPDDSWRQTAAAYAEAWQRHQERWPRSDQTKDPSDVTGPADRHFAQACDKVEAAEQDITGRLQDIEAQQPDRALLGIEFCLKGRDRVVEKAAEYLQELQGFTPAQAVAMVPDSVRYTFGYETDSYVVGVKSDIDRLKADGFEMLKLKNLWGRLEYKGINSQWHDTVTGQRFEVQFHTKISFEAKQLTHGAYERIRDPASISDRRELAALHRLQRDVTARIPLPPGIDDIRDHV